MSKIKVAIDENLSPKLAKSLQEMYGHLGYDFMHVKEIGGGKDEIWAETFNRFGGQLIVSGDINIAKRPHQQAAFVGHGFVCFFPQGHFVQLRPEFQVAYLMHAWKCIHNKLSHIVCGSCWQMPVVYRENKLSISDREFKEMKVPESILNDCRKKMGA